MSHPIPAPPAGHDLAALLGIISAVLLGAGGLVAFIGNWKDESTIETEILRSNPKHPDALGQAKKRVRRRKGFLLLPFIAGLLVGILAIVAAFQSWTY